VNERGEFDWDTVGLGLGFGTKIGIGDATTTMERAVRLVASPDCPIGT
jgi:hypothetical protein